MEEETSTNVTYVIERSYPKMNVQEQPFAYLGTNERIVNLLIETTQKLSDEFFTELGKLVSKYTDNQ